MTLAEIRNLVEKTPFRPFQIELSSSRRIPVLRPETIMIPHSHDRFIIVANSEIDIIDPDQIVSLIVEQNIR